MSKYRLVPLGDIHWGNPLCDKRLVKKNINRCKSTSINEVWLVGDLIEYVNKYSVGKQVIPINQQINEIVELLKPIKNKITLIIHGNHEERAERVGDPNPTELIACKLGLEDTYKYSHADFDFSPTFKRKYYVEHPLRGGAKSISRLDLLYRDLLNTYDAEIFIMAHFHRLAYMIPKLKLYSKEDYRKIPMILAGGYVKYWGSYGHTKHMEVSELGSPLLIFDLDKYTIEMKKMI